MKLVQILNKMSLVSLSPSESRTTTGVRHAFISSSTAAIATVSVPSHTHTHTVDRPSTLQLQLLHEKMLMLRLNTVWVTKCRSLAWGCVLEQIPHLNCLFTPLTQDQSQGLTAGYRIYFIFLLTVCLKVI